MLEANLRSIHRLGLGRRGSMWAATHLMYNITRKWTSEALFLSAEPRAWVGGFEAFGDVIMVRVILRWRLIQKIVPHWLHFRF